MPAGHHEGGLWGFSLRTYRLPGVPDACLSLQNDYGADVNMLFFCCWIGAIGGELDRELLARAAAFSALWANDVVLPIRSARSWMKHTGCSMDGVTTEDCMTLRKKIKSVELATEKLQQQVLESLVSHEQLRKVAPGQLPDASMDALKQYVAVAGIEVCEDVRRKLSVIVDAAFAGPGYHPSA